MKIHSLRGPKAIPDPSGEDFVTDGNDDVEVPDDLGEKVLGEQPEAWAPAEGSRYDDRRKADLVAEAQTRGLDDSGTVAELRERLAAHDVNREV